MISIHLRCTTGPGPRPTRYYVYLTRANLVYTPPFYTRYQFRAWPAPSGG